MPIKIAIPKETASGENRVALAPAVVSRIIKSGAIISLEKGAGKNSGYTDEDYKDVTICEDKSALLSDADIVLTVQPPAEEDIKLLKEGCIVLGYMNPFEVGSLAEKMKERKVSSFAMELIPRITRAQAIDSLSSQASAAGYKAAIMAADLCSKFFPMLTTAAGTVKPAKVLIIGAGVAGLQAIATAKRLGAIVEAYDVRSATREEVESLGAKFIDTGVKAEGAGGYARELTEEERLQQQQVLEDHIAAADAVITTASVPGKKAPQIISKEVVEKMKPGSVIIDLAAETGGNCELTKAGKKTTKNGVVIYGPTNVASSLAKDTSEMYSRNLLNFLKLIIVDEEIKLDFTDQVIKDSCFMHNGEICFGNKSAPTEAVVKAEVGTEAEPQIEEADTEGENNNDD
ncbi:MAG: NAD(P) transhydrogenase subunit alpha [Gammaproteobacteria bacterium]|nr:MAG: NAD(P) transhydrogenase subunit alpha [Gammaproteobacteria bacterium]